MLGWFRALMPKAERFFDLFEAHAQQIRAGALALRQVLNGGPDIPRHCQTIIAAEHEADNITREVLIALRRSFITPFDRSDITELIRAMDDTIDAMQSAVKAITVFEIRGFDPSAVAMGDAIVDLSKILVECIPLLRQVGDQANRLTAQTEAIGRKESEVDELYDIGRRELFTAFRLDPMTYLIQTQIIEYLEEVADRFDDVGNQLSSIVIEQA
jgi:predicted phosphate transport protein (TIGR00153 family)